MKIKLFKTFCLLTLFTLILSSCSIKKDDLEGATIYTTVYPVNYLVKYLYNATSNTIIRNAPTKK